MGASFTATSSSLTNCSTNEIFRYFFSFSASLLDDVWDAVSRVLVSALFDAVDERGRFSGVLLRIAALASAVAEPLAPSLQQKSPAPRPVPVDGYIFIGAAALLLA